MTVLLSVLEAVFEILIPLCIAKLIDQGIEHGNMSAVWKFGIIILVFAVFYVYMYHPNFVDRCKEHSCER